MKGKPKSLRGLKYSGVLAAARGKRKQPGLFESGPRKAEAPDLMETLACVSFFTQRVKTVHVQRRCLSACTHNIK